MKKDEIVDGMRLKSVDIEALTRQIRDAHMLLIMINDGFIEALKDPEDLQHEALNLQIHEAAKGEKDVYLLCFRPIEKDNFSLVMDMLEGSKLKCIVFTDPDDDEDVDRVGRLLRYLTGPGMRISGTSKDSWVTEKVEGSPPSP
jgi:hypothetical protein